MAEKPKRVTARRVRPFYNRLFRACSDESLLQLKEAINDGRSFNGKRYDTCVYGNLAKGAGYDFAGKTPNEIVLNIREFGRSIGVEIKADGRLDYVEQFCAHAGRGDIPETDLRIEMIDEWLNFVLMERGFNFYQTATVIDEEVVGV